MVNSPESRGKVNLKTGNSEEIYFYIAISISCATLINLTVKSQENTRLKIVSTCLV